MSRTHCTSSCSATGNNLKKGFVKSCNYQIWGSNATAQPRMATKLQETIDGLDANLKALNEAYAAGAVEGFDDQTLV